MFTGTAFAEERLVRQSAIKEKLIKDGFFLKQDTKTRVYMKQNPTTQAWEIVDVTGKVITVTAIEVGQ